MKDVLVLGASGTIGIAVSKSIAKAGANVHAPGRHMMWCPDNPWGLVCCFGNYGPNGKLKDMESIDIIKAIQLNLYMHVLQVQKFLRLLGDRPGRIVLLSGANVGGGNYPEGRIPYTISKFGIVGFVEALSKELDNVCINAVAPGPIKSNLTAQEKRNDWINPNIPAKLITKLIMDEKEYYTGNLFTTHTINNKYCMYKLRSVDG